MSKTFLSDATGEPVVWWHGQNLSSAYTGRSERGWLHFWDNYIGVEWAANPKMLSFGAECEDRACGDENFHFHFSIPHVVGLFFCLEKLPIVTRLPGVKWQNGNHYSGCREVSFTYDPIENNFVHWRLWRNPHIGNSNDWRDSGLFIDDLIFGPEKYSQQDIEIRRITIKMPEGDYEATARRHISTWTHKRWRKPRSMSRVTIDIPNGIPHPGHGENDWDQDDDATFAWTTKADTIDQAVENLKARIIEERERYGGDNWRPSR